MTKLSSLAQAGVDTLGTIATQSSSNVRITGGYITANLTTTSAVSNTAISGLITSGQIASVANTQVTGLITSGQIATVANTQVTGLITSDQIASVANTKLSGLITSGQIASIDSSQVAGLGTIASQASTNISITGGNIHGVGLGVEASTATSNVLTINYANATVFTHTATTNLAITPSNFPQQQGIALLKLTNGGAYTVTYAGNCGFVANTAPTLTSSGTDFLFIQGNTTHYSVFAQLDVR